MFQSKPSFENQPFWIPAFQLPIAHLTDHFSLPKQTATDLELIGPQTNGISIYDHIFGTIIQPIISTTNIPKEIPKPIPAKEMAAEWAKYFTTDVQFLKQSQEIVRQLPMNEFPTNEPQPQQNIKETWEEITLTDNFNEKFNYLEFKVLEPFNRNSLFLESLNLIHLITPIASVAMFVFFILLPILLMVSTRSNFSIDAYVVHMAALSKYSFMGKMAKSALSNGWLNVQTMGMIIGCLIFYGVQFYNSYTSYTRFWRNIQLVNDHLMYVRQFCQFIVPKINAFLDICGATNSFAYKPFCTIARGHLETLRELVAWTDGVEPFAYSIRKCYDFGKMFHCYYEFHHNKAFDMAIRYAAGFHGYWDNLCALQSGLLSGRFTCASFSAPPSAVPAHSEDDFSDDVSDNSSDDSSSDASDNSDKRAVEISGDFSGQKGVETPKKKPRKPIKDNILTGMYYPTYRKGDAVENDCDLAENIIITGPNASGKTTYLKTVALNLIFTQQFGMGCYSQCVLLRPYTQFLTYLNIPDTSDRDSLFQAEVRRGKVILDAVCVPATTETKPTEQNYTATTKNTFMLMDELFSGTNHDDAVQAAYGFLCYLGDEARRCYARFLLTTHFVEICDAVEKAKVDEKKHVAVNGRMAVTDTATTGGDIQYLYKFEAGISRIKCGIQVLRQMGYPAEVLSLASAMT